MFSNGSGKKPSLTYMLSRYSRQHLCRMVYLHCSKWIHLAMVLGSGSNYRGTCRSGTKNVCVWWDLGWVLKERGIKDGYKKCGGGRFEN